MRASTDRMTSRRYGVWLGLALSGCVRAPRAATSHPNDAALVIQRAWDFDDPRASEARLRALAERAAEPDRAQLETQIARALALEGRYPDAVALLDSLEPRLGSYPEVVRIRWLLERGRCLRSSGFAEASRPLFLDAWERARADRADALAIDAAHMVALTMSGDDALAWNQRALDLATTSADPLARRWRTSIYNNIAWTYHDAGAYDRALVNFQRALNASRELDAPGTTRIAEWSVGRALRSLGRHSEALAIQVRLDHEAAQPDGYVAEEIAENLLALGRAEESRPYFAKAFVLLSGDHEFVSSEPLRLERLHRLGGPTTEGDHD